MHGIQLWTITCCSCSPCLSFLHFLHSASAHSSNEFFCFNFGSWFSLVRSIVFCWLFGCCESCCATFFQIGLNQLETRCENKNGIECVLTKLKRYNKSSTLSSISSVVEPNRKFYNDPNLRTNKKNASSSDFINAHEIIVIVDSLSFSNYFFFLSLPSIFFFSFFFSRFFTKQRIIVNDVEKSIHHFDPSFNWISHFHHCIFFVRSFISSQMHLIALRHVSTR